MQVLHFFKTYIPETAGGIEQVIFQLCQGMAPLGIESQVLTLSPHPQPARITLGSHEVIRTHRDLNLASTGFSLQAFRQFRQLAAEADLIHLHFPWPFMDLVHLLSRTNRPCVLSYHSDIVRQKRLLALYRPLMHHFLAHMDRIVVASPNYLESSSVLPHYQQKTEIIPFGLDPALYPPPAQERLDWWRQQLGTEFFLSVGVLRYYKGLNFALDALRDTDYPYVILGSGPEEAALKHQARQLGLKNTRFLGRLDDEDKNCLLNLCLALIFPSHLRSEAFGISLLEASLHGRPMISCEIGTGTSFVNQHGQTGLVIPPASPLALQQAMTRLWHDRAEAQQFGQQARLRFEQQFTAEKMCHKMAALYQRCLSMHSSSSRA